MQPLTAYPASSLQSRRHRSTSGRRNRMRVHLKGIHTTHKKLASGKTKKYYYAWKNGPRIDAEPGTPNLSTSTIKLSQARRDRPDRARCGT